MAIIEVDAQEFSEFMPTMRNSRTKYPWHTKKVGEGFFVPREDLSREDYRPVCPPSLTKAGQVWKTAKGFHPKLGKQGLFIRRIK